MKIGNAAPKFHGKSYWFNKIKMAKRSPFLAFGCSLGAVKMEWMESRSKTLGFFVLRPDLTL